MDGDLLDGLLHHARHCQVPQDLSGKVALAWSPRQRLGEV
jgi:hypothetical protein